MLHTNELNSEIGKLFSTKDYQNINYIGIIVGKSYDYEGNIILKVLSEGKICYIDSINYEINLYDKL